TREVAARSPRQACPGGGGADRHERQAVGPGREAVLVAPAQHHRIVGLERGPAAQQRAAALEQDDELVVVVAVQRDGVAGRELGVLGVEATLAAREELAASPLAPRLLDEPARR